MRVVCLTEESTETLYRIGAGDFVVGVSGFTVRPLEARLKPKISRFLDADTSEIEALRPDLILAFSDLQAEICRDLGKLGMNVMLFNQRSVAEILQAIRWTGALVDRSAATEQLARELEAGLDSARARGRVRLKNTDGRKPRIWIEEWPEPLIGGIAWFRELVEIAGGEALFPEHASGQAASERMPSSEQVIAAQPDAIIASWCGKMVKPAQIRQRQGWQDIPAVRDDHIYEVPSPLILQPGPAALDEGLAHLEQIMDAICGLGPTLEVLGPRRARGVVAR